MTGVPMPAIEECPECGSDRLWGVEQCAQGVTIDLDGQGGVATIHADEIIGTTYSSLGCSICDEMLVEGGEVVHSEVDA